jgi:transposase
VGRIDQPVLPLTPAQATPIGSIAALAEGSDGGVVFVSGLVTFTFAAGDRFGRKVAAAQLASTEIATVKQVAAAFGVHPDTLSRWKTTLRTQGVGGLMLGMPGPKGPRKLTDELVGGIRELESRGLSQRAIAARAGVDSATVRVALGRRKGSAGWEARKNVTAADVARAGWQTSGESGQPASAAGASDRAPAWRGGNNGANDDNAGEGGADRGCGAAEADNAGDTGAAGAGGLERLPVLPAPISRDTERVMARWGLLEQAVPVFTPGAHLPLAGLLLILPALAVTGLLEGFDRTYGGLKNGFYGLRVVVLTMVFLAMLRDPRAEGLTRVNPADLGRMLGLDRAPEVKTLRRKLSELACHDKGAELQRELAAAHAKARPEALGFLLADGHLRAYFGTRDLQKTHVARLHMAARATAETWIADTDGDPVMVLTAPPSTSLAAELVRLLPELRTIVGQRRVTLIFDRGGWSPEAFQTMTRAGFDLITYRKGEFEPLPAEEFSEHTFTAADDGAEYTYTLAETTASFKLAKKGTLSLRQIHKRGADGTQVPVVTSREDLAAAEVCWRLSGRWRHENFFRYQRQHFALDALDCYADLADDGTRLVPNPAKTDAKAQVSAAKQALVEAKAAVSAAIDAATEQARRPGKNTGPVEVDPAAISAVKAARTQLELAQAARKATPSRVQLATIRPDARLLDNERKLITHAVRMAAYNAETTLARMLRPHYARAEDEARALLREAMTLPGDLDIQGDTLHIRLDPATAPRRSRALHALCRELTATQTHYPGTNLTICYSVKGQPDPT